MLNVKCVTDHCNGTEHDAQLPHLLRVFYEWLLDNDMTPHLLVDANAQMVLLQQFARATDRLF